VQALQPPSNVSLQLLLFVDQRPISRDHIRQIRSLLGELSQGTAYDLQIVDVAEQPYLAEHFRLITTPALIKIAPEPRQMLTGTDLIMQLRNAWGRWQQAASIAPESIEAPSKEPLPPPPIQALSSATELLSLSEEIFRLKQEKEELKAQLVFKDQIVAMLAHDLRNPLTAASIAMETLDRGFHSPDVARITPALIVQVIRQGRAQLKAIDLMIMDMLQASHGSQAEIHLVPQSLKLETLCKEILVTLENRFREKDLQLETDIPSDLPMVYADAERIRQVITNLLDNAIKYTRGAGTIHLSALHRTTQKVQITICDNGPGIPEDKRHRIFEDSFRLQRDVAQDGYGIGLSLCQRIVRAHYGQIWVDSVLDQGSCFHFTLPVYR
jgi:two-component system, OmpR family, clock-associated histidine kinase SasA